MDEATRTDAIRAVNFALRHKTRLSVKDEAVTLRAARAIVDHLELANFKITRGPPAEAPSTSFRRSL